MAYHSGDLQVRANGVGYDAREDDYNEIEGPVLVLPHSCDSWVIGGIKEARALIADLDKAIVELL